MWRVRLRVSVVASSGQLFICHRGLSEADLLLHQRLRISFSCSKMTFRRGTPFAVSRDKDPANNSRAIQVSKHDFSKNEQEY